MGTKIIDKAAISSTLVNESQYIESNYLSFIITLDSQKLLKTNIIQIKLGNRLHEKHINWD